MLTQKDARLALEKFCQRHPAGNDDQKVPDFYQRVSQQFNFSAIASNHKVAFIVVGHFVHSLPYFLEAITAQGHVVALISKQSGVVSEVRESIHALYRSIIVSDLNKTNLAEDPSVADKFFRNLFSQPQYQGFQFVILDHGGYFAPCWRTISKFPEYILGVVEHTWNGEIRYGAQIVGLDFSIPIYSVARSKLKNFESKFVASSILDAISTSIAGIGLNQSLQTLNCILIIGYGHIGEHVARALKKRLSPHGRDKIYICDVSSETIVRARQTFNPENCSTLKKDFLAKADFIITATSTKVLTPEDLHCLKQGAVIACATSSDDQFAQGALADYEIILPKPMDAHTHYGDLLAALHSRPQQKLSDEIKAENPCIQYQHRQFPEKRFYLLADGDSINFRIGSTSHPIIHAILASILQKACLVIASPRTVQTGIHFSEETEDLTLLQTYEHIFGSIQQESPPPPHPGFAQWRLPAEPKYFVGRNQELTELNKIIATPTQKITLISGLGGIGKSQLIAKWVNQTHVKNAFQLILYLSYSENIYSDLKDFLRTHCGIEDISANSKQAIIEAWYAALSQYPTVLIILDDVTCYTEVEPFLQHFESMQRGHLRQFLVGGRNRFGFSREIPEIPLRVFSEQNSYDYLHIRLPAEFEAPLALLSKECGDYPLVLATAVNFCISNQSPIAELLQLIKQSDEFQDLLQDDNILDPEEHYSKSLLSILNLQINVILEKQTDPNYQHLLDLLLVCCIGHHLAIPKRLLEKALSILTDRKNVSIRISQCLKYLEQSGFLSTSEEETHYQIHPLISYCLYRLRKDSCHELITMLFFHEEKPLLPTYHALLRYSYQNYSVILPHVTAILLKVFNAKLLETSPEFLKSGALNLYQSFFNYSDFNNTESTFVDFAKQLLTALVKGITEISYKERKNIYQLLNYVMKYLLSLSSSTHKVTTSAILASINTYLLALNFDGLEPDCLAQIDSARIQYLNQLYRLRGDPNIGRSRSYS